MITQNVVKCGQDFFLFKFFIKNIINTLIKELNNQITQAVYFLCPLLFLHLQQLLFVPYSILLEVL